MNTLLLSFHGFSTIDQSNFNRRRANLLLLLFSCSLLISLFPALFAIVFNNPNALFWSIRFALAYFLPIFCGFVFYKLLRENLWDMSKINVIHAGILCGWIGFLGLSCNYLLSTIVVFKTVIVSSFSQRIYEAAIYDVSLNGLKVYLPFFLCFILFLFFIVYRAAIDTKMLAPQNNFGSAEWASTETLDKMNAYNSKNGIFIGTDMQKRPLYLPMVNKLTLAPPGTGKTTASTIPTLLSNPGGSLVFDIKGELWAVTARYRHEIFGHKIILIDPFGVTKSESFRKGKSKKLLKRYGINPFDSIPDIQESRDRILNAFAASLVINEGGYANHFDENAKILIRGVIDYLMSRPKNERSLPELYRILSLDMDKATAIFEEMSSMKGRAGAAANQINRVGVDERGSILSTTYRQIDWIGDSNMENLLTESNFKLKDFLKGDMDIYVVLPEDQVKEHARLFRMIMVLIIGELVQADPKDLPKEPLQFLLEEVAQLGASPDIEQCIEILRARRVVLSAIFQTLDQVKMFKKPGLFLTMPFKQIFTNDDPETMEWIQKLAGDRTILTKSVSTNTGNSKQTNQVLNRTTSHGEGESVHETGVKLIHTNEISTLPNDEQFIFFDKKNIRCKKVRYFENKIFEGKYDPNPLEERSI